MCESCRLQKSFDHENYLQHVREVKSKLILERWNNKWKWTRKIIFPWRIIKKTLQHCQEVEKEPNHNIKFLFLAHQHVRTFSVILEISQEHFLHRINWCGTSCSESIKLTCTAQLRKQLFCPGPLRSPFVSIRWWFCAWLDAKKEFREFCIKICCWNFPPIVIFVGILNHLEEINKMWVKNLIEANYQRAKNDNHDRQASDGEWINGSDEEQLQNSCFHLRVFVKILFNFVDGKLAVNCCYCLSFIDWAVIAFYRSSRREWKLNWENKKISSLWTRHSTQVVAHDDRANKKFKKFSFCLTKISKLIWF